MDRPSEPNETRPPAPVWALRESLDAELVALHERVEAALVNERRPIQRLRALSTPTRVTLATAVCVGLIGGVAVLSLRADFRAYPKERLAFATIGFTLLLALLVARVLRPLHRVDAPKSRDLALAAMAFLMPLAWAFGQPRMLAATASRVSGGNDCLPVGLLLGGLAILAFSVLDRATEADMRTKVLGAAAGGVVGNLALAFHCPRLETFHLVLVHAPLSAVLLLFALLGVTRRSTPD
ncbi:MAG TPA: NrsF family protein [Polyangiaceae bacterium]|nr:NrsF family protein [Polyangiaceae bacterium]